MNEQSVIEQETIDLILQRLYTEVQNAQEDMDYDLKNRQGDLIPSWEAPLERLNSFHLAITIIEHHIGAGASGQQEKTVPAKE